MKNKKFALKIIVVILIAAILTFASLFTMSAFSQKMQTQTVTIRSVGQAIVGQGEVHSSQEAVLHFQTGGKLVYLPFKEGDQIYAGQTIAQLDTFPLQEQLKQALNNYRSTRDVFDQTQANALDNVAQGQQRMFIEAQTKSGITAGDNENTIISDIVKRIVDENQANLDNSVVGVELSNYALQLASLQAPFNGVITHEDVTSINQNITPSTSFAVADPSQLVFRANISSHDIDFVKVGSAATIILTGSQNKIVGTVTKIYPTRMTTTAGDDVYQVDIAADGLNGVQFGQTGVVSIVSSNSQPTAVVPTWTIIGHNSIWVLVNNKPVLKEIMIGVSHGETTEVYGGLTNGDKIITDPESIARKDYISL